MPGPKLKVLAETGAVCAIEVGYDEDVAGWTEQVTDATRTGTRGIALERQRGRSHARHAIVKQFYVDCPSSKEYRSGLSTWRTIRKLFDYI